VGYWLDERLFEKTLPLPLFGIAFSDLFLIFTLTNPTFFFQISTQNAPIAVILPPNTPPDTLFHAVYPPNLKLLPHTATATFFDHISSFFSYLHLRTPRFLSIFRAKCANCGHFAAQHSLYWL
jgi:hypothetical protein